jgi:hypothetical protein
MTLDEARTILGVARGASHASIRDAFRIRARHVHPDAHPTASAAQRDELARHFDRAREARDILLLLPDGMAAPAPTAASTPPPPPPPPWYPTHEPSLPPAQRTLRFDEFVQVVDAAGFGPGHRSAPARNIGRTFIWLVVGALSVGVLVSVAWTAFAA